MIQLQDKQITVDAPVEIDNATNQIRLLLSQLTWVSHPFHIAHRFSSDEKAGGKYYYPETYVGYSNGKYRYHRLTPDNDYSGMFFFIIGDGKPNYKNNTRNFITYDVGIIFSCNLKLIDNGKMVNSLYTQELIRQVRRKLTESAMLFDFQYSITAETRHLRKVYREFSINDMEQYNRAPMQCFRLDLEVTIKEECVVSSVTALPSVDKDSGVITVINSDGVLPVNVDDNTSFYILNLDNMTQDVVLDSYKPVGLIKGATVRVRKIDDSPYKIKFQWNNISYTFVDKATEYIDLLWDGSKLIV